MMNVIKRRYQIQCAQRVPGIIFIRYTQKSKGWKTKVLKVLRASKPKGLNRMAKIV